MDPIDTSPAWNALYPALATPEEVKLQALKLCAVRETFEECGILLAESDSSSGERVWEGVKEEQRRVWRDKVRLVLGLEGRELMRRRCIPTERRSWICSRCFQRGIRSSLRGQHSHRSSTAPTGCASPSLSLAPR
mgnify:FL=1